MVPEGDCPTLTPTLSQGARGAQTVSLDLRLRSMMSNQTTRVTAETTLPITSDRGLNEGSI